MTSCCLIPFFIYFLSQSKQGYKGSSIMITTPTRPSPLGTLQNSLRLLNFLPAHQDVAGAGIYFLSDDVRVIQEREKLFAQLM